MKENLYTESNSKLKAESELHRIRYEKENLIKEKEKLSALLSNYIEANQRKITVLSTHAMKHDTSDTTDTTDKYETTDTNDTTDSTKTTTEHSTTEHPTTEHLTIGIQTTDELMFELLFFLILKILHRCFYFFCLLPCIFYYFYHNNIFEWIK